MTYVLCAVGQTTLAEPSSRDHRLVIVKAHARLAALIVLAIILAGCGPLPHPSSDVADFQGLFPTLAAHHVTYFSDVNRGCQAIVYERGTFVTDPSDDVCTQNFVGAVTDPRPFDATARADFDAIEQAAAQLGFSLYTALPVFGADGSLVGGQFMLDDCTTYFYDPGWSSFPTPAPGQDPGPSYAPFNTDWYLWECTFE